MRHLLLFARRANLPVMMVISRTGRSSRSPPRDRDRRGGAHPMSGRVEETVRWDGSTPGRGRGGGLDARRRFFTVMSRGPSPTSSALVRRECVSDMFVARSTNAFSPVRASSLADASISDFRRSESSCRCRDLARLQNKVARLSYGN